MVFNKGENSSFCKQCFLKIFYFRLHLFSSLAIININHVCQRLFLKEKHNIKEKIKVIQEYDALLAEESKVNKTKFAAKIGIPKSSLCTVLDCKTRQSIEIVDF